ncbi:hypothetical protein Chor_010465 [Crotalus horridus]
MAQAPVLRIQSDWDQVLRNLPEGDPKRIQLPSNMLRDYTIHASPRNLEGHVYDVNCCRFFPSGIVVLSGGMDARLKIWSADSGSCVATFQGHKAGILDTAIVERGRNVVSSSRDGTARLWDCGRLTCLGVIADCGSPVNGIALNATDNSLNLGSPEELPSEREVGTEGKLLLLAREDKKLQGVGLQSRQPDGTIYQLDVRNTKAPVRVIQRSGAPVLSLMPYKDGFIASQGRHVGKRNLHLLPRRDPEAIPAFRSLISLDISTTDCKSWI